MVRAAPKEIRTAPKIKKKTFQKKCGRRYDKIQI